MLTGLKMLDLDYNYFKGTIPSEMGLLTDLGESIACIRCIIILL